MGMAKRNRRGNDTPPGHDPGYKRLFSHPVLVEELLRRFVRGDWISRLDFSTLERVGNSFVSEDLRERHSDLIWRLRLRGSAGGWVYLYLLLEFQSTPDPFMAVRLLTYVGLLLEEIIRKEGLRAGDRLPIVLPLVLYNGRAPWRSPRRLRSLFVPVPRDLQRYLPSLDYLVLDEGRLDLQRPDLAHSQLAALFQIEISTTLENLLQQYRRLKGLASNSEEPGLPRTFNAWVLSVARRIFPGAILSDEIALEETPMLEENLIAWREKFKKEAVRQGRQEGVAEGMQKLILQQMTQRFGRLPAHVYRQIEEISSLQELRKLGRRVLRAKSLEEMGLR